ncbi:MAG: hypothetical protein R2849_22025 [Thermomicrobiales bacterium]
MFRSWGASIIGMTAPPEARLAREAELCYACLAMVTDYDVWHEDEDVSVEMVIANLQAMTSDVVGIVTSLVSGFDENCSSTCRTSLDNAIITGPDHVQPETWSKLGPLTERYVGANLSR